MAPFFNKVRRGLQKIGGKVDRGLGRAIAIGDKVGGVLKKVAPAIDKGVDFVQSTGVTSLVPGLDFGLDAAQKVGRLAADASVQGDRLLADAKKYQTVGRSGDFKTLGRMAVQDIQASRGEGAGSATIEKRANRAALDELPNYSEDLFM